MINIFQNIIAIYNTYFKSTNNIVVVPGTQIISNDAIKLEPINESAYNYIKFKTNTTSETEYLQKRVDLLETMLSDKQVVNNSAKELIVSQHALFQYRSRIGYNGDDISLKKLIYKEAIKHLATMDVLPDGKYPIANNAILRIKDNTVCTVTPRVGTGKKALDSNRELKSARDSFNAKKNHANKFHKRNIK